MLLEISQWLANDIRAFSVIQYITLRAVLAALQAAGVDAPGSRDGRHRLR